MALGSDPRHLALPFPLIPLLLGLVPTRAIGGDEFFAELLKEPDPHRCQDLFDKTLTKQCMRGEWEQKYYFDAESRECRLFWYDGCPGLTGSRNFFDSLLECQWLCEPGPPQQSSICHEHFDEHLRDECDANGNWHRHFYFDRAQRRCVPFWFGGCTSPCGNHFEDEISCKKKCGGNASGENGAFQRQTSSGEKRRQNYVPAWRLISTTLRAPIRGKNEAENGTKTSQSQRRQPQPHQQMPKSVETKATSTGTTTTKREPMDSSRHSPTFPTASPLSTLHSTSASFPSLPSPSLSFSSQSKNHCAQQNPCQNGGTCVYDVLMQQSICKCASPFTNDFCTERIDFDPCSPNPCKNGATCSAIADPQRTEFDCFCARGFAGRHCEFSPCDDNPCQNGGTCRTTRSQSLFFCACPSGWGGKTCMIEFSSNGPLSLNNANLTQQLSSGRAEWIDELKRVTPLMPKSWEEAVEGRPNATREGFAQSALPPSRALSSTNGQLRPDFASSVVSSVLIPHDQIVGNELPTRTLKGATPIEATNDAKNGKNWTDGRVRHNSVLRQMLSLCLSLILSLLYMF